LTEGPVLERAMQRTKTKNATSKTPNSSISKSAGKKPLPGTPSLSEFTTLQASSLDSLAKVAQDSCIVFSSTAGSQAKLIQMIQARELAQAELAKARQKIEQEKEKAKEASEAAQVEPVLGTGKTSLAGTSGQQGENVEGDKSLVAPTRKNKKVTAPVGHRPINRRARALGVVLQ
jgi:hypothetical protein